ncbi:MAG TPA: ATP-binding protein [Gemmatimonadaceae bacterium]
MSPVRTIAALWHTRLRPRWRQLPLAVQLASTAMALMVVAAWGLNAFLAHEERSHEAAEREVERLHRLQVSATSLALALVNMESGRRSYVLTGDTSFLQVYELGRRQAAALSDSVDRLGASRDPELRRLLDAFLAQMAIWRTTSADGDIALRRRGGLDGETPAELRIRMREGRRLMDEARRAHDALLRRISSEMEATRLHERDLASMRRRDAFLARIALGAAVLLVLVVWMRVVTRTLRRIVCSANAVADGDYDRIELDTDTGGSGEMSRLAAVFERLALAVAEREQILRSDILQLRELEQMKSAFVSTVSHELRTPLTSVRGALGLVLGGTAGEIPPKTRDLLRIAHQNTERLIRLINDILDIEKLESGQLPLRREPCDLAGIARTTIAALDAYAEEHGVRVVLEPPTAPVVVAADADRLVQVATNLISNAVKFSPRDSTIRVAVEAVGGTARLTVADRGPGIPVEFQSRIFGRFQQADSSGSRAHGGTGLGLSIVRSIIDRHGGSVRFETSPGGTTFIVELPHDPPSSLANGGPAEHGERVLVMDPDPDMRSILGALCAPLGEAVAVGSPEEAWRALSEARFDAVVADPAAHPDGLAFLARLRGLPRFDGVPVLVFSEREYAASELEGVTLAASHAFVKSRDREAELVMRLRAALLARRASRDAAQLA